MVIKALLSWLFLLLHPADRYVAKLTGLPPEDPWAAALADQAYFFCEDLWLTV